MSDHICATDPNLRVQPSQRLDALLAALRGLRDEIELIASDTAVSRELACLQISGLLKEAIDTAEGDE